MSAQHVLIIGAGVCGLAIAHGLQKSGIPFTIFEAEGESTFRPREWTMALHWSIPMLESLLPDHLAARLKADASVDPCLDYNESPNNNISIFDGKTGKVVREIVIDGISLRVSRRKLRALCHEGIDVKYGCYLERVSYNNDGTVNAIFSNGAQHTGTILIGSDGPRSCVREQLFGREQATPQALDIVYLNVSFRYGDAEKARFVRSAHPVTSFTAHPECLVLVSMQDVPDPQRPETWRFQLVVCWEGMRDKGLSNAERHKEVKEKAATLAEPHRSAVLWMPEDVEILYSDLGCWVPRAWDTHEGRVTLAGDAAHSMPPNRGQGLNHALNDAYNFVEAVKKVATAQGDRLEVIQAYSDEVAVRGAKETELSRETAFLTLDYSKFTESALMRHGLTRMPDV